jgi:hypothetical protein
VRRVAWFVEPLKQLVEFLERDGPHVPHRANGRMRPPSSQQ